MMNTAALGLVLFQLVSSHAGTNPASPAGPAGAANSASGVTWTIPKGWLVVPSSSPMRFATYKVAATPGDKEAGEVSVFAFAKGDGGSVDSNVARWQGQFQPEGKSFKEPAPQKTKAGTLDVTIVTTEGTFSSGMPGGSQTPKNGWALRGAIVEGPGGSVFFKLVGPKKTVVKETPNFDALIKSLKKS
jgi:hypothetical protein